MLPAFASILANIPDLRPPRGLMPPSWWDQNGWQTGCLFAVLGLLFLLLALQRRHRPAVPEPSPFESAQQILETWRERPEDGMLVQEVSRLVRRQVITVFNLPGDELTTDEILLALKADSRATTELVGALGTFLRACEAYEFAPDPPQTPGGVVARAMALLAQLKTQPPSVMPAEPVVKASSTA